MISFIIIGQNEGWKLKKCLKSVYNCVNHNYLNDYEVLYVDSASTDDSISTALSFSGVRVYNITGTCNAAVSRNVGAKEAKGEVFFFIDGDMELEPSFLSHVYSESEGLQYDYCSGHLLDYIYDDNGTLLIRKARTFQSSVLPKVTRGFSNGGIFLVKRHIWQSVNGMKTEFKRNQDLDFAMRLYKRGISVVRIPQVIAKHNTFDYSGINMNIKTAFRDYSMYPALMHRRHFFSPEIQKKSLRSNYTAYLLFFTLLSVVAWPRVILFLTIIYFVAITIRSIARKSNISSSISLTSIRIVNRFLSDIIFVFAFFTFWPKSKKLEYVEITRLSDNCLSDD